jgi:peptidoglycan/xylan/chitin deacetylase (PgdA/CDA1 family)
VHLSTLLDEVKKGRIFSNNVSVTFDDGYANNYTNVFPLLEQNQIPATIFLPAAFVDTTELLWHDKVAAILILCDPLRIDHIKASHNINPSHPIDSVYRQLINNFKYLHSRELEIQTQQLADIARVDRSKLRAEGALQNFRILSWKEIAEMSSSGLVEFGCHTLNHTILSMLNQKDSYREITESLAILGDKLESIRFFSYPNGSPSDFDSSHKGFLQNLNLEAALTTINGRISARVDFFELPRYLMDDGIDIESLDFILTGGAALEKAGYGWDLIRGLCTGVI